MKSLMVRPYRVYMRGLLHGQKGNQSSNSAGLVRVKNHSNITDIFFTRIHYTKTHKNQNYAKFDEKPDLMHRRQNTKSKPQGNKPICRQHFKRLLQKEKLAKKN